MREGVKPVFGLGIGEKCEKMNARISQKMKVRNFCIIAHIDHGKSTLADRFLEVTGTVSKRDMKHGQMLDTMELEQERGITIKLQPARMEWKGTVLNLIDTPGHVDFQYEVSRSLAACEGAILVVDASQGVEAQTLSNVWLAMEQGLEIIPVLNKIDLPAADVPKVEKELKELFGFDEDEIMKVSAKTGEGVEELLDLICEKVPDPEKNKVFEGGKSKVLVLAGCWGAGKTSVAKMVAEKQGFTYLSFDEIFKEIFPDYFHEITLDLHKDKRAEVWQELINRIKRETDRKNNVVVDAAAAFNLVLREDELMKAVDAEIDVVILFPRKKVVMERYNNRGYRNEIGHDQIEKDHDFLTELKEKNHAGLRFIDNSDETLKETCENHFENLVTGGIRDDGKFRALIFDSWFDQFQGVVALVRVMTGELNEREKIWMCGSGAELEASEIGFLKPGREKQKKLVAGDVGFVVTGSKDIHEVRVGDTITLVKEKANPLPGFKRAMPMVFAGFFAVESDEFEQLRDALEKLSLNDAALVFEPETSTALGFGFRVGFLGLLHMEIVQERLEREWDIDLIATTPSVSYEIKMTNGKVLTVSNPAQFPDRGLVEEIREPIVRIEVVTPKNYLGGIFELLAEKHGESAGMEYLDQKRVIVKYDIPLAGIITDFYDRLKSISQGYASVNYEAKGFKANPLEKMDILVAGENVDALAVVVHKEDARHIGLHLVKRLKEIIPRANFVISIQAALGSQVLARENIPAFRKDVTAKLYGGDKTRRDKLLKKQKAGKKRMKSMGKVNLPQDAFLAILKK